MVKNPQSCALPARAAAESALYNNHGRSGAEWNCTLFSRLNRHAYDQSALKVVDVNNA
ncbi:MAG: hypothetical protein RLZZ150_1038 [Bacteroidota bacterium]